MTSIARYSLLTMRPDPERIDLLCVGALVHTDDGAWNVLVPGVAKLETLGYIGAARRLMAMAANLRQLLDEIDSITSARSMLTQMRSTLSLNEFEGVFAFDSIADFQTHLSAITSESILIPPTPNSENSAKSRRPHPMVKTRLRRHFRNMGILAESGDLNPDHQIVSNYPLSAKHGLKAEFAMKNTVWHITETVDFDVASEGFRNKTFEAQAKCLVLHAAKDILGSKTERYIVAHGSKAPHAANSVDLLTTVGTLFRIESDQDMTAYLDIIGKAARSTSQLR